jgi:hypothetical protein
MRNPILYASLIFTISALLIGAGLYSAEARDASQTTLKGNGVEINDSALKLIVNPLENSKEFSIQYGIPTEEGLERGICKDVTDKVVKISALKKASIKFSLTDKKIGDCKIIAGGPDKPSVDISITIDNTREPTIDEIDKDNGCHDGVCSVTNGQRESVFGTATVSIDGDEPFTIDNVKIFKVNQKTVSWNQE